MCGLSGFFARESVPDYKYLHKLFLDGQNRGEDGFGLVIIKRKPNQDVGSISLTTVGCYYDKRKEFESFVNNNLEVGDLLLAINRAAPEQEPPTSLDNIQPINSDEFCLVHNGSVSNIIHQTLLNDSELDYTFKTEIDSESIIASYVKHNRNIKDAMEYISGGVSAMLYDYKKDCLYLINDFKPLAQGYIRGYGYFLASNNDTIGDIIEDITGCTRDGICLWENYYHHYLSGGRIKEIDLDSGFVKNIKYQPRYITQNWDSNYKNNIKKESNNQELCLVSASGGFDSSLTLAILKLSGYQNIIACHFKYGHRGQEAEEIAITNVCKELNIPLKIFDVENLVSSIDPHSMLIDENAKITTGTKEGLKKLDAWVNGRNMIFLTIMASFAESQVMEHDYQNVHLLGGFLNLTESGHYPDNSEYFISSFLEHCKYSTLIGNRIKPLYCLSNLMKSDQFFLMDQLKLHSVWKETISCDRPIVENGIAKNCSKDGIPACGSGLLSYWASKMVGLDDMKIRNFYEVDDPDYQAHIPTHLATNKIIEKDIKSIIDRILIPNENKKTLYNTWLYVNDNF